MDISKFNNTGPVAVAKEAKAIRTGTSTIFSNRGDRVARQTAFLTSIASQQPKMARLITSMWRNAPHAYAMAADVPETIIGMYGRIMEDRLALVA